LLGVGWNDRCRIAAQVTQENVGFFFGNDCLVQRTIGQPDATFKASPERANAFERHGLFKMSGQHDFLPNRETRGVNCHL